MFLRREHLVALVVAVCLAASAQPSHAQWPVNGVPLCTAVGDQYLPKTVSDGAGGAFVTWYDLRSGVPHIYAQHVLPSGAVDPVWTAANGNADGTPLCTAVGGQSSPTIVTDGSGGAIVTWTDARKIGADPYAADIYAQHVLASGAVDPAWTTANGNADGTPLTTAAGPQGYPTIVTDGAGGAIVAWEDSRYANYPTTNIYAQHLLASGAVDPAWPVDGSRLTADGRQFGPMIVTDGAGGAIVTWTNDFGAGIYAQHVLASGAVDPVWTTPTGPHGTPLCTASGRQDSPTIVTDGSGGAIVTWDDLRNYPNTNIYAQRVNAAGVVQWIPDGTPLCTVAGSQVSPTIVMDGTGGAIVTWMDSRNGNSNGTYDIYAQRVNAAGVVQWIQDGTPLCTAVGDQYYPTIVTDMAGGAIVTWMDSRSGNGYGTYDIYAQHALASGAVDPAWTAANGNADGTPLCTAAGNQQYPTIVTDMAGGAIVTWMDNRGSNYDIYAQRVFRSGGVSDHPPTVSSPPAINGAEGGTLAFDVSASDPDEDAITSLTANLLSLPEGNGATFTPHEGNTSGSFLWHTTSGDAGTYQVSFRATANDLSGTDTTTITVAPAGAEVTGLLTWTPRPGDEGVYNVIFSATDAGGTSTLTTAITVVPGSPSPAPLPPLSTPSLRRPGPALSPDATQRGPIVSGPARAAVAPGTTLTVPVSASSAPAGTSPLAAALRPTSAPMTVRAVQVISLSANLTNLPPINDATFVVDHAPVVGGPSSVTANAGVPITFVRSASDVDGDPIAAFTADLSGLPAGNNASFSANAGNTVGTFSWTPKLTDAGTFVVSFTASNQLVGNASTTITVNNVNRAPTANPGGPYSGVASVPVVLNGSSSSDPDGNSLRFDWDFENDGVFDATGVGPTHTYAADGVYTVKLRVTDDAPPNPGVPALSDSATTTATIQAFFPARVFRVKTNKIQLYTDGQHHCFQIEPIGGDFAPSDVNLSTVVMRYGAVQVSAETGKTSIKADTDHNGIAEIQTCFSAAALRTLFVPLPIGVSTVTVSLEGNLTGGGRFHGDVTFKVQKDNNSQNASVSPNPLNPEATLTLFLPKAGFVRVKMYDLKGRLVRTLMEESDAAVGYHDVRIDGRGAAGEKLASGVYFYHVESAAGVTTGRFVVMK